MDILAKHYHNLIRTRTYSGRGNIRMKIAGRSNRDHKKYDHNHEKNLQRSLPTHKNEQLMYPQWKRWVEDLKKYE